LFWSYRKHVNEVRLYDAIMLGVFCAALVSIARGISYATTPLQTGVTSWPPVVPFSLAETVESFLIGLGLGLGFRVIDLQEVKHHLHLTKGFTTRAALPEAKKRGLQLNEISKLLHALAAKPRQPTKVSPPQDRWGTGQHVTDEAAPILYSKRAIYTFTFFFSVIFGAGLMVINLRTLRRPEGVVPTVSFSIGFLATVFLVLDYLQSSSGTITSRGYLVSYLGSWLILKLIWDKYIGKDQKYRKRSVFFPLLVGIALIVGYLFFVTRFSTHV